MLVYLHDSSQHAAIILKMDVPVSVAENDIRSAVRPMLIRAVKKASKVRLDSQHVKVVPAGFHHPYARRIFTCVYPGLSQTVSGQAIKAAIAIAKVYIVGIRLPRRKITLALDVVEAIRLGHIQRAEYKRVQNCKHNGIRTDTQCHGQHGSNRKAGRLAQKAKAVAHVLKKPFTELAADGFLALFLISLQAAE